MLQNFKPFLKKLKFQIHTLSILVETRILQAFSLQLNIAHPIGWSISAQLRSSIQKGVLEQLAHKTCTRNTPGLHTPGPQLSMYAKHTWPTYTREAILHVRKTRPAYIHPDPNSSCTQNTPDLHTRNYQLVRPDKGPAPPPWRPPPPPPPQYRSQIVSCRWRVPFR